MGEEAGVLPAITQRDLCDPVERFCEKMIYFFWTLRPGVLICLFYMGCWCAIVWLCFAIGQSALRPWGFVALSHWGSVAQAEGPTELTVEPATHLSPAGDSFEPTPATHLSPLGPAGDSFGQLLGVR